MHIGKLNSVRTVAEIFCHLGNPDVQGNALILMAMINRGYRSSLIKNFKLILSIIVKGEPRVDQAALEKPDIESEITLRIDREERGLTWVVKQSFSDNVFLGSSFGTSYKLERIIFGDNTEYKEHTKYRKLTFCNYNSNCAIF